MNTHIGHIIPSKQKNAAGLLTSVNNISESLNLNNISSSIYSVHNYPIFFKKRFFINKINSLKNKPDIFHSHGLWKSPSILANFYSKEKNIPYIISPHGMLDRWALNQNKYIKKIYWNFKEKDFLSNCNCIHALCESEYKSIRDLGITNRIEIIPNPVEIPNKSLLPLKNSEELNWYKENVPTDIPYMLFLGRLNKKKGINELIQAWNKMQEKKHFDVYLIIAGFGDLDVYKNIINKNKIKNVKLLGSCFGMNKNLIFSNSSGFILPSYSEGLPMAALEALSWGIPTYITKECNLDEFLSNGAAFEIKNNINALQSTLEEWAHKTIHESKDLEIIGDKGRNLVKKKYTQKTISKKLIKLYDSLL